MLHCYEDLERAVVEKGFLPFFKNDIPGFSVEEMTPPERWFSDELDGPWEWKGPVACGGRCAYGKFFGGKAGFVSLEWFPELVNYRRRRKNNMNKKETMVYNTLFEHESLLSKELKTLCGFITPKKKTINNSMSIDEVGIALTKPRHRGHKESFDTVMTRLQKYTFVVIADFEYQLNKANQPYGWGIARYTIPELLFGKNETLAAGAHTPKESKLMIKKHLMRLLPQATEEQIIRFIG